MAITWSLGGPRRQSLLTAAVHRQQLDDESGGDEDAGDDHRRSLGYPAHRSQSEYARQNDGQSTDGGDGEPDLLHMALLRDGHGQYEVHRRSIAYRPPRCHIHRPHCAAVAPGPYPDPSAVVAVIGDGGSVIGRAHLHTR